MISRSLWFNISGSLSRFAEGTKLTLKIQLSVCFVLFPYFRSKRNYVYLVFLSVYLKEWVWEGAYLHFVTRNLACAAKKSKRGPSIDLKKCIKYTRNVGIKRNFIYIPIYLILLCF